MWAAALAPVQGLWIWTTSARRTVGLPSAFRGTNIGTKVVKIAAFSKRYASNHMLT